MYENNYPETDRSEANAQGYNSQNVNGQYMNTMNQPKQEPPRKEKKPGTGFGKKALISVCLGLFFGICAALGFKAVTSTFDLVKAGIENSKEVAALTQDANEGIEAAETPIDELAPVAETTGKVAGTDSASMVVTDITDVVKAAMPAVVSVNNNFTETISYFGQEMTSEGSSSGSGIIVGENDTELLVVTNFHVVDGAEELQVQFVDETQASAQVKGKDEDMDLAVIAIPLSEIDSATLDQIAIATLGDSDALTVGEPAIAIGNALGYGQSVTYGVVSALNRPIAVTSMGEENKSDEEVETFIQTDAAINPGNSGGALLNIKGEVIGINSNKIGGVTVDSIGYAIPISAAKPIIEDLMTKVTRDKVNELEQGYLGISGISVSSEYATLYNMPEGVYISQVFDNTAASTAGLQKGDVITKFDGDKITSMEGLKETLSYYSAGETVTITVKRPNAAGTEYTTMDMPITLSVKAEAIQ